MFQSVCAHSEHLVRFTHLIEEAKSKGLVLFGWGEDFGNQENVDKCKKLGMDGIIYDM